MYSKKLLEKPASFSVDWRLIVLVLEFERPDRPMAPPRLRHRPWETEGTFRRPKTRFRGRQRERGRERFLGMRGRRTRELQAAPLQDSRALISHLGMRLSRTTTRTSFGKAGKERLFLLGICLLIDRFAGLPRENMLEEWLFVAFEHGSDNRSIVGVPRLLN